MTLPPPVMAQSAYGTTRTSTGVSTTLAVEPTAMTGKQVI